MGFRDILPPSLQEIVQDGLLDGVFDHALQPAFLFEALAELKPWGANLGSESILTRDGLIPVSTTAITGSDASATTYGFEQYSIKMDQWGTAVDTNLAVSAMALASKFIEDNQRLGVNAAETLNQLAQQNLYGAFAEGTTWVTTAQATASTTCVVNDATGFQYAKVLSGTSGSDPSEGLTGVSVPTLVPVSATNTLDITVNGASNTVVGVDVATDTLTLGTAVTQAVGDAVVSAIGPVMVRPNARASAYDLVATDICTLQNVQAAVTRLRTMRVPPIRGAYTCHAHPQTIEELFQDAAFQRVYTGRADSQAYLGFQPGDSIGDGAHFMGRFMGVDWIMNTVVPSPSNGTLDYYQPIVCGQGCLIKGPFENQALDALTIPTISEVQVINGVARIWRAPLDRLGQVISSAWKWTGGWSVGTDMLTGDSAVYKRAVVIEHA